MTGASSRPVQCTLGFFCDIIGSLPAWQIPFLTERLDGSGGRAMRLASPENGQSDRPEAARSPGYPRKHRAEMGYRMAKNRRPCAEGGFRLSYESGRKPTQRPNAGQGSTNPSGMPSLTLCRPDQVSAETSLPSPTFLLGAPGVSRAAAGDERGGSGAARFFSLLVSTSTGLGGQGRPT